MAAASAGKHSQREKVATVKTHTLPLPHDTIIVHQCAMIFKQCGIIRHFIGACEGNHPHACCFVSGLLTGESPGPLARAPHHRVNSWTYDAERGAKRSRELLVPAARRKKRKVCEVWKNKG